MRCSRTRGSGLDPASTLSERTLACYARHVSSEIEPIFVMGHACLPAGVRVLRDMCRVQAVGLGAPEVGGNAGHRE